MKRLLSILDGMVSEFFSWFGAGLGIVTSIWVLIKILEWNDLVR